MGHIRCGGTTIAILNGTEDLSVWTDEELIRGQRKSRRGTWEGRPPKVVPKAIHDELVRRKMSQAYDLLRDNVVKASEVLIELASNKKVDAAVRLKAVGMIHDRVLGKAPARVQLTAEAEPWLLALQAGVVSIGAAAADQDVMDAEVIEVGGWDEEDV